VPTNSSALITGCLFWPLLFVLLLEGMLLGIGWWTIAAAAIASLVRLVCKLVEAHQLQCALVADVMSLHEYNEAMCLSPHLRWELEQIMSQVRPVDLSVGEIAGLLAILAPAHSRVIGGPTSRPALRRSIDGREHAALLSPNSESIDAPVRSPVSVVSSTTPTSLLGR
jgi:hypothetical protein